VIILILLLVFELYLLNKILKFFLLSPIYLYVGFSILSLISTIIYFYFYENKFSLYNLDFVTESAFLEIIKMYLLALLAFVFGIIVYYDLSISKIKKLYNKPYTYSLFFKYEIPKITVLIVKVLFFLILILFFLTYGKGIFIREDYLPEVNRPLVVIIKILSFIEIILLGITYHKHKLISSLYFFMLILLSLGTGSRSVFLFILLYFCILFISQGNTLINKMRFSINILLSFVFLAYLMQLRGLDSHGIIPYIKNISLSGENFIREFYFNIYYSLIFGVFVTLKTIQEAQPDWNIIFVSLNPLPGIWAGWYSYASDMRLNEFAPYSLHGRIFTMGTTFTLIYFFITGLIYSYMEKKIRVFISEGKRAIAFILVLLLILHIVYGFEYNLRSAFRYIYYAFFIIFVLYFLRILRPYMLKKKLKIE